VGYPPLGKLCLKKGEKMIYTYIAALVVANLLVSWLGPWFSPINAFFLIALDLVLRDKLHERWSGDKLWIRMGGIIVAAGAISYLLNPASQNIAIASVVAFCGAALVDTFIYQKLIKHPWFVKVNGSNAGSALTDSTLFPTIAFGSFLPHIVLLQFASKVIGGAIWSWVLRK
jgi:hypothetical protein